MNEITPEVLRKIADAAQVHPTTPAEWSILGLFLAVLLVTVYVLARLAVNLVNKLIEAKSQVEVVIANNTSAMQELRTELTANREATEENREAIRDLREYLIPRVQSQSARGRVAS